MLQYENIGKAILASYDTEAVKRYLAKKGENIERIALKGWHVATYFEEDDLAIVIYDERKGSEISALITIQDFYINTDDIIELQEAYRKLSKDSPVVNVYRMAAEKLAYLITMLPTFQAYYYRYNLAKTSKIHDFSAFSKKIKAA